MRNSIGLSLFLLILSSAAIFGSRLDGLSRLPDVSFHQVNELGTIKHLEGKLTLPIAKGNEISETFSFLNENKELFNIKNAEDEFKITTVNKDQFGYTHIRLKQQYLGVPVISGDLITHFSPDNVLKTVNGNLVENIDIDVVPAFTSSEAVQSAQSDLASFFGSGSPTSPELVVFPWEGQNYLCWRFYLLSDTPMGRWEYFVNAKSNETVFKANRIMNAAAIGTGLGVMGNAYDHVDTDFNGSTYSLIDYTRRSNNNVHNHNGLMGTGSAISTSVASSSLPGVLATDSDNFWTSSSQASAIDGHMYTLLFYDWMLATLGRNGFNDNGGSMSVTVDYVGEGTNNAYWNGSRIVVWGWSAGWRSLAGCPDVIAHEWGHAVTQYTSDMAYQKESGALNESFSDMIGAAFEFAHPQYDSPDWYMGENGIISGNGFRSMSNPNLYGDPATYGDTDPYWNDVQNCTPTYQNDWCYVHTNSGVGNKWFFLLSDGGTHNGVVVDGIGVENAIKVAYRANASYWTSNTTYQEAALGTISAANDLDSTYAWTVQVSKAWNAVGIDAPNPEINFTADTTWGWVPLDVNFEGTSVLNVLSWDWNLGDGTLASTQNVSHQYTTSGMFNVTLEIDAEGDIKTFTQPSFIVALADTVVMDSLETQAGESVEVIVNLRNTIPLKSIILPVEMIGSLPATFDSFSTAGCRTDYLDYKEYVHFDNFNKRFTFRMAINPVNGTALLPPGYGEIIKLYFTVNGNAQAADSLTLETDGYESYLPFLEGEQLSYSAASIFGSLALPDCLMRGDVNNDSTVDIADLVAFVDYSFNSGTEPSPIELADVNCNGTVDIEDIVYLVAFMFNSGPALCGC